MRHGRHFLAGVTATALMLALTSAVSASETITYTYDTRGRLVTVNHGTTGPNANASATYAYDHADNRTSVNTDNGSGGGTCVGVSFAASNNPSANEGSNLTFTVTKAGTTSDTCTVNYGTSDNTAHAGTNYTAASGSLSFGPTTSSQSVSVATIHDGVITGSLSMYLNLSSPNGSATISAAQATGTINNIDVNQPPVTQADSVSVACNASKTLNVTANDTDPEGNYPLTVLSVTMTSDSVGADASVASASTLNIYGGIIGGTSTATYTVKDSLGATSTGTVTITTTGTRFTCT